MSEQKKISALIDYRLQQAQDALSAAKQLADSRLYRESVSRAYYSMFYCALAMLAKQKLGTSKHSGVLALINREFVRSGVISKETAKNFRKAFELRLQADYQEFTEITAQQADELIENAKSCLEEIKGILEK